jgi:hypothetical protein
LSGELVPDERPVIEQLNEIVAALRVITGRPLSAREQFLIEQIHSLTEV